MGGQQELSSVYPRPEAAASSKMPASPLDVEAQVDGGNGNRWFLETSYLACRVLELVSAG